MVDSGASYHVVSANQVTGKEFKTYRRLQKPIQLQTANGTTTATHQVDVYIRELDITISAIYG